jgi:3'-phosphoadenosine 5'-phosphosulfate sulfotransferase
MGSKEFINICKEEVRKYAEEHLDKSEETPNFDVYVVWGVKALQNHKALLSTSLKDGMYYELTYNGDKEELYFDAYKKFENKCIKIKK